MRKSTACLAIALTCLAVRPCGAADHVLAPGEAQRAAAAAAGRRAFDLEAVSAVLATPEALATGRALGVDAERLASTAAALSDAELAELAARARALGTDPVAGLDPDVRQLLIIFLIVAIVILVFQAVD
jgi:hypothetical protein